jgi:hypothetical protein
MLRRCDNPKDTEFANYGGRGITVCERWRDFKNFIADMGEPPSPRHSIDRIDNDGNYQPYNCRWATPTEQALNKRTYKNARLVHFRGETMSVSKAARLVGLKPNTVYARVRKGWPVDRALEYRA